MVPKNPYSRKRARWPQISSSSNLYGGTYPSPHGPTKRGNSACPDLKPQVCVSALTDPAAQHIEVLFDGNCVPDTPEGAAFQALWDSICPSFTGTIPAVPTEGEPNCTVCLDPNIETQLILQQIADLLVTASSCT